MQSSPLRHVVVVIAASVGLFSALIGVVFLIAGAQAYLGPDFTDTPPFAQLLYAVGFIGLPAGMLLMLKARHSFKLGFEKYGLPDPPIRSFLMSAIGIVCLVAAISAFVIVWLLF
jgi:hypothetical protein